jgi:hypothetical protein
MGALVSWLLSLLVVGALAPQAAPARSRQEAAARWRSLPEAERSRLRRSFEEFRKLPPVEQDLLRARAREVARERERLESRFSKAEREALAALGGDAKDAWLGSMLRHQLQFRHKEVATLLSREKLHKILSLPPGARREALKDLETKATRRFVEITVESAAKRKLLPAGERERILALPLKDGAREALALRKKMVVHAFNAFPERRPAALSESDWVEVRELPPEKFFPRLEMVRALGQDQGAKPDAGTEREMRSRAKAFFLEKGMPLEEAERLASEQPLWKVVRSVSERH